MPVGVTLLSIRFHTRAVSGPGLVHFRVPFIPRIRRAGLDSDHYPMPGIDINLWRQYLALYPYAAIEVIVSAGGEVKINSSRRVIIIIVMMRKIMVMRRRTVIPGVDGAPGQQNHKSEKYRRQTISKRQSKSVHG